MFCRPRQKPLIFYFSLMTDAYETIRHSCRTLLIVVLVMPNFYSAPCLAIVQFSSPFTLNDATIIIDFAVAKSRKVSGL